MAEAAGLAFGTISIASLFSTCLEALERIDLAQRHGEDYEVSLTKLLLLKARFHAWGESLCIAEPGRETGILRERWQQEQNVVGRSLISIQDIFQDSHNLERKYGLKVRAAGQDHRAIAPGTSLSRLRQIETALRASAQQRQDKTSVWKKTQWAIRDKQKFDLLLSDLMFYVDNLEKLSDRLGIIAVQRQLLSTKIQEIETAEGIKLLQDAVEDQKTSPTQSPVASGVLGGHRFIENIVNERAKVIEGDIGDIGPHSHGHLYENNMASGDSRVVYGNTTADFARDFFR